MLTIDHVLLATPDLAASGRLLHDQYGLESVEGGRHPGWGTANRIVPVGDAYLELVTVVDESVAMRSAFGRWVAGAQPVLIKPLGWAVRTTSIVIDAARHELSVSSGSRTVPTGQVLRWRVAGVSQAAAEPYLPFLIEWGAGTPHPSQALGTHTRGTVAVARVELTGSAARLTSWLHGQHVPTKIEPGDPGVSSIVLMTPDGEVTIDATVD